MVAMSVWPTDAGDGSVATEFRWRRMARLWAPTAIVARFGGEFGPSLSGLTLTVQSGAAWVDGHYCELTTTATFPVGADGRVTIMFDPAANSAQLLWTPGAGLVPIQTPDGVWELPICFMSGGVLNDVRVLSAAPLPQQITDSVIVTNDSDGVGHVAFPGWAQFTKPPMVLVNFADLVGGTVYPVYDDTDKAGFDFIVLDPTGAPYGDITVRLVYMAFQDIWRLP